MKDFSFYREDTGELAPWTVNCPDSQLAANTPTGFRSIAGKIDAATQRVDLETGEVVAFDRAAAPVEEFDSTIHRRINELETRRKIIERGRGVQPSPASVLDELAAIDDQTDTELAKLRTRQADRAAAAARQRQD